MFKVLFAQILNHYPYFTVPVMKSNKVQYILSKIVICEALCTHNDVCCHLLGPLDKFTHRFSL